MDMDLKVAQLMCSRLCHDLVGPVGAVNAGLELLDEEADPAGPLDLVGRSAREAGRRLAFFRMAFGMGGVPASGGTMGALRDLVLDYLAETHVTVDWPAGDPAGPSGAMRLANLKLLANMVLVGIDSLPRGGTLSVRFADLPEGLGVALIAAGAGGTLRDELRVALSPDARADDLTARNVHGHLVQRMAAALATAVEVSDSGGGEVRMAVILPAGEAL